MIIPLVCSGQIDPQWSLYAFSRQQINPATVSADDNLDLSLAFRTQWVGLTSDLISTQGANVDLPLIQAKSGIGLSIGNDLIGEFRVSSLSLQYGKAFEVGNGRLNLGLTAAAIQVGLNGQNLRAPEGTYEGSVVHNDQVIPVVVQTGFAADAGLGVYWQAKHWFLGLSATHLLPAKAKFEAIDGTGALGFNRTFYVMGGFDARLSKKIDLQPTALFKTDMVENQLDVGLTSYFNEKVWAGLHYRGYNKRSHDSVILLFGLKLGGLVNLTYAYDAGVSSLRNFNNGSHEVVLHLSRSLKGPPKRGRIIYNPRFPG